MLGEHFSQTISGTSYGAQVFRRTIGTVRSSPAVKRRKTWPSPVSQLCMERKWMGVSSNEMLHFETLIEPARCLSTAALPRRSF